MGLTSDRKGEYLPTMLEARKRTSGSARPSARTDRVLWHRREPVLRTYERLLLKTLAEREFGAFGGYGDLFEVAGVRAKSGYEGLKGLKEAGLWSEAAGVTAVGLRVLNADLALEAARLAYLTVVKEAVVREAV